MGAVGVAGGVVRDVSVQHVTPSLDVRRLLGVTHGATIEHMFDDRCCGVPSCAVGWYVVAGNPRPDIPWREFERALTRGSGWRSDGTKLPARPRPEPPAPETLPVVPWAELHCHSAYSFLDGASEPEQLVAEAAFQGVETLAMTDHDGMYRVVRFAEAAREAGLATVFGAELSLGLSGPQNGRPDPEGGHLLVLARDADGLPAALGRDQRRAAARPQGPPRLRPGRARGRPRRAVGGPDRVPQRRGPPLHSTRPARTRPETPPWGIWWTCSARRTWWWN